MRSLRTAAKSSPHVLQLEKACIQQWKPSVGEKKKGDPCRSQNTHCEATKSLCDFCCPHPICPGVLGLVFKAQLEAQPVLTCSPHSKDASLLQDPLEQDGEYDEKEEGKEHDDDRHILCAKHEYFAYFKNRYHCLIIYKPENKIAKEFIFDAILEIIWAWGNRQFHSFENI